MIQFNLLPSVKMEYVRNRRTKRLVILVASLVAASSLAILIVLFIGVSIVQKKYSHDLSKNIKTESSKLNNVPDLNKILTIQNQLKNLTSLHDKKPVVSRTYGYIKQITPTKASIAAMKLNFDDQTMEITGSADSISTINKFVDTIKFTTYKTEDNKSGNAFTAVVLATFGRDDKGASYNIKFKYDPAIFDNSSKASLTVPAGKITTRSETEKPESLFQPLSNKEGTSR